MTIRPHARRRDVVPGPRGRPGARLVLVLSSLLGVVGSLVGGAAGQGAVEHHRRRRNARAFARGEDVVFAGCALGSAPYCRPPSIAYCLVLTATGLYACVYPDLPSTRRDIPEHRLSLRTVRPATRADAPEIPPGWLAAECTDDATPVVLATHELDMPYVLHALRGKSPVDNTPTGTE